MTQYVQPAQAFGAVASYTAQNASPQATDLLWLMNRIAAKGLVGGGTQQAGTIQSFNTNSRVFEIPDDVYAAYVAAGVDFSDAQYNANTAPGTMSNTSELPTLWNPGLHRQLVICVGDSITNSAVGANSYKAFALLQYKMWAQGVTEAGPAVYVSPSALPSTAPQPPQYAYTKIWANAKSRIKYNYGHDSWRLANQAGFNYQTPVALNGSPHNDNTGQFAKLYPTAGQQVVVQCFAGTNDFAYADDNSNPGLFAVPTGTSGYTYAGSPDYFTNCLSPFIALVKALYPTCKFILVIPIARSTASALNAKFVEVKRYAVANKASLGIDLILDTTQIAQYTALTPTVTTNATYYQNDGVHPTPQGPALLAAYFQGAYDKLLGFTPDPSVAAALL